MTLCARSIYRRGRPVHVRIGVWVVSAAVSMVVAGKATETRAQPMAGSVEGGLQVLAQEIVNKSVAQERNSTAVLPFPNADGSCSVLSTYLADEFTQALFAVPGSPLTIVERSQLEAVISEIQIGSGGLLDPTTTQSLGKISGVKTLTIGTVTQMGDRIRINARVVSTETGKLLSAASTSIPRTSDIDSLVRQPIASQAGVCGIHISAKSPSPFASEASQSPMSRKSARSAAILGMVFEPLSKEVREQYHLQQSQSGLIVIDVLPGSKVAERGIKPGDLIMEVQGKPVSMPSDVDGLVKFAQIEHRASILLLIQNRDGPRWVPVPLSDS